MQTLWNSRATLPAYPPLREDLHADAAVVGGGMAGILTAYALHTRGLRVVLLEGSRLASGVTAHTTAKITAQHGLFCERLVHDFGFHLAQQYLRANLCAVRQFRALVRQKRIDCGFSDESSFIYAAPDGPSLTRELEYALSLGAPARLVTPEGLPFPVREALCFERQAQLSPLPFLAALLRRHGHGGAERCRHALPHARALRALRPAAAAGALVSPCADWRAAAPRDVARRG